MEKAENKNNEYYTIDLLHIFKTLWRRVWVIIMVGLLGAVIGFSCASFVVTPTYSSSVMLYVNNGVSVGGASFSISSSQIMAAQDLVKTYVVLLNNRTTLEAVADKAGVSYGFAELSSMIKAGAVDETEVMKVEVTAKDPYEAEKIANAIATVLPRRISEIIEGSTMAVVDSAVVNLQKVSPSVTKYTAIGLILGALVAAGILAIVAIQDGRIHDEEYLLHNYPYPILAKIPELGAENKYGYSYHQYQYRSTMR